MVSQSTRAMRIHPGYESAKQRDKRRAKEDIHRYLDDAARLRHKLAKARILSAPLQQAA